MVLSVPPENELNLETARLILEPVMPSHAKEMMGVLNNAELYRFIPGEPPRLPDLEKLYRKWSKRISPEGDELWLNWIARMRCTQEVIGHFQAGVREGADSNLGYTIGLKFQRQGFAKEALREVLNFLNNRFALPNIKCWIDTRNEASIKLVEKLGMKKISFIPKADHFNGSDSDEFVYQLTWVN